MYHKELYKDLKKAKTFKHCRRLLKFYARALRAKLEDFLLEQQKKRIEKKSAVEYSFLGYTNDINLDSYATIEYIKFPSGIFDKDYCFIQYRIYLSTDFTLDYYDKEDGLFKEWLYENRNNAKQDNTLFYVNKPSCKIITNSFLPKFLKQQHKKHYKKIYKELQSPSNINN